MTAEKGEHERAPNVSDSYPTPLRATLRAPPSKWAIRAFFPAGERSEPRSRTARRAPADRSPRRIATWAASGVAVPRAFFGTFFRFERKYCPPSGRQPHRPRRSRRVKPQQREVYAHGRTRELSSGQTIGAVRTAVRSACCLPELRVANRLRRLYPLDDGELFKFNLKSSVCQRQTGLPKGNPPCAFPAVPAGVLGRREGAGIQWMQLPKAVSD